MTTQPTILEDVQKIQALEKELADRPGDRDVSQRLAMRYLDLAGRMRAFSGANQPEDLRREAQLIAMGLELSPDIPSEALIDILFRSSAIAHYLGRNNHSVGYVRDVLALQDKMRAAHPLARTGIRLFQTRSGIQTQFGHLCSEIDVFLKMRELGWLPKMRPLFCLPGGRSANESLLNYWRKDVCVVTSPRLCERLSPLQLPLEYNTYWVQIPEVPLHYGHASFCIVQNVWERDGRAPVLTLTERHKRRGAEALKKLGVPEGCWFVTCHVRSFSLARERSGDIPHSSRCRDADLNTYRSAIQAITDRGGYVIRMGDPSMPKLDEMPRVIDYAHSPQREGWLDLYLLATSKFLLGTGSGPPGVATALGTPVLFTNVSPPNCFPQSTRDIYVPKLLRPRTCTECIPFEIAFQEPFKNLFNANMFDELGIELMPNTEEDLRAATVEMLDRLDGVYRESPGDEQLHARYRALSQRYEPMSMVGRIASDFLRKHQSLLPQEAEDVRRDAYAELSTAPDASAVALGPV